MRGGYLHSRKLSGFNDLSRREVSIIRLICEEKISKEIGDELGLSKRSIESAKNRVMHRLNLNTSVGLVKYAIKNEIYQL